MNAPIVKKPASNLLKSRLAVVAVLAIVLTAASLVLVTGSPARPDQAVARQVAPGETERGASQSASTGQQDPAQAADATMQSAASEQPAAAIDANALSLVNDAGRYSIERPGSWQVRDLGQYGVNIIVLTPSATDTSTRFTIQVIDSDRVMTVDDMPMLIESFDKLIRVLPETNVLWQDRYYGYGNTATVFEAKLTYRDGDTDVTRWVRLVYAGAHEYLLVAESDNFTVWQDAFNHMMVTFWPYDAIDALLGFE